MVFHSCPYRSTKYSEAMIYKYLIFWNNNITGGKVSRASNPAPVAFGDSPLAKESRNNARPRRWNYESKNNGPKSQGTGKTAQSKTERCKIQTRRLSDCIKPARPFMISPSAAVKAGAPERQNSATLTPRNPIPIRRHIDSRKGNDADAIRLLIHPGFHESSIRYC